MPREISDAEYQQWQIDKQIAGLANEVWDDPQLGPAAKELLKRKRPGIQIPDHDIRTEMRDGFAKIEKNREEEKLAEKQAKEDEYWKGQRRKIQDEYGYTDDGMKDLEKMMMDKNIGDYEVAATYHTAKNPKASEPSGYKDPYWNHGKSDTFKEIAKDPEEWGRSEIMKALQNDQRRNRNAF
jgi:hypothetical protein